MTYPTLKPDYYRTPDGSVYGPLGKMSLHRGFWWSDVGLAIAPEGCEVNLPIWEVPDKHTLQPES